VRPSQIAIARRVFSPDAAEVAFALKILAAMPDRTGAVMVDGKMRGTTPQASRPRWWSTWCGSWGGGKDGG
jgi:citrate lyase beta subunit